MHVLRCTLGYTLLDEVHQPKGYALRYILYIQLNFLVWYNMWDINEDDLYIF